MDWTAIGAIAGVLGLPLAFYLGTRRRKARIYAEPGHGSNCRIVVENGSETPVVISHVSVLWPLSTKIGLARYGDAAQPWEPRPRLETQWGRTISPVASIVPGKTGYLDFEMRSKRRDTRNSCWICLHVDESRAMQISKIRVIKTLQIPATDNQRPSILFIG